MRVKTTKELQNTFYPEHMLWVPVQDVRAEIQQFKTKYVYDLNKQVEKFEQEMNIKPSSSDN